MTKTLSELAIRVLRAAEPAEKARAAHDAAVAWRGTNDMQVGSSIPPDRPARPERPALRSPREVPRRRITSGVAGRIALLHALAHIELNAIDLAFDIVVRFADQDLPRAFYDDWVAVGDDEARHYLMLAERLAELGAAYGDMNAHDGLWQAAAETADDLLARLAVVPLVLEARGLDVTPTMIGKLQDAGDDRSAEMLQVIHDEEITHVAAGARWFRYLCEQRGLEPARTYGALVRQRFKGSLKPPFNRASRDAAGLPPEFYEPLVAD
ncbi:MAG: ferritin-like domain-containing protein [Alphaproteobacteria bacterium]|nr:ferritin-like domain-containing protein [Alphaproteobacteria bacterium]